MSSEDELQHRKVGHRRRPRGASPRPAPHTEIPGPPRAPSAPCPGHPAHPRSPWQVQSRRPHILCHPVGGGNGRDAEAIALSRTGGKMITILSRAPGEDCLQLRRHDTGGHAAFAAALPSGRDAVPEPGRLVSDCSRRAQGGGGRKRTGAPGRQERAWVAALPARARLLSLGAGCLSSAATLAPGRGRK